MVLRLIKSTFRKINILANVQKVTSVARTSRYANSAGALSAIMRLKTVRRPAESRQPFD